MKQTNVGRNIIITPPRPNQGKPKGGYRRRGKGTNLEWLHGRKPMSGQKPQSPIRSWADMSDEEKAIIRERLDGKHGKHDS